MPSWIKEGNFANHNPANYLTRSVSYKTTSVDFVIKSIILSSCLDGDFQVMVKPTNNPKRGDLLKKALQGAGFPCCFNFDKSLLLTTTHLGHLKSYLLALESCEPRLAEITDELFQILNIQRDKQYDIPVWVKTRRFDYFYQNYLPRRQVEFEKMLPQTIISDLIVCDFDKQGFQIILRTKDKNAYELLSHALANISDIQCGLDSIRIMTSNRSDLERTILAAEGVDPNISVIKHEMFNAMGIAPIQVAPDSEPAKNNEDEPVPQAAKNNEGEPVPQAANNADNIANAALQPNANIIAPGYHPLRNRQLERLVDEAHAFIGNQPLPLKRKR